MRAFTYWEKVGLIHLEYSEDKELSGICLVDVNGSSSFTSVNYAAKPAVASEAGAPAASNTNTALYKPTYSADELDAFCEDDEVSDLLFATQTYLGKPLSNSDTNTVLFWYDVLHMNVDLIQYLIETCIGNGHSSFHYMDTVARNWAEDGITTVEDARKSSSAHNNTVFSIKKALGIGNRDLVESELNYIDKWTNTFGFSLDIICEACERTITATNKPSFKYTDSILTSWYKASVKSMEDVVKLDQEFTKTSVAKLSSASRVKADKKSASTGSKVTKSTNKFLNFEQRQDYDFNALEKKLLGN
jgi:DnaD/phage-associated family protein